MNHEKVLELQKFIMNHIKESESPHLEMFWAHITWPAGLNKDIKFLEIMDKQILESAKNFRKMVKEAESLYLLKKDQI